MLERVARRLHAQHVELEVSDEAVDYLADAGYDPQYGARPLRRAIQRMLDDELSERLLAGEIEPGQHVRVDVSDGALPFEVRAEGRAGAVGAGTKAVTTGVEARGDRAVGQEPSPASPSAFAAMTQVLPPASRPALDDLRGSRRPPGPRSQGDWPPRTCSCTCCPSSARGNQEVAEKLQDDLGDAAATAVGVPPRWRCSGSSSSLVLQWAAEQPRDEGESRPCRLRRPCRRLQRLQRPHRLSRAAQAADESHAGRRLLRDPRAAPRLERPPPA